QLLLERRLVVARRRRREMLGRLDLERRERLILRQRRQGGFFRALRYARSLVEPFEREGASARLEDSRLATARHRRHHHGGGVPFRRDHLRGDEALPDELVEPELLVGERGPHPRRGQTDVGRTDRLVRLLRRLHFRRVVVGLFRQELRAV